MLKAKVVNASVDCREIWNCMALVLFTVTFYLFFVSPLFAQTVIGGVLCSVYGLIYYDVGRGLATFAVIVLGVGAMLGRVTWGQAVVVGAGIAGLFGAMEFVSLLTTKSLLTTGNNFICGIQGSTASAAGGWATFISKLFTVPGR